MIADDHAVDVVAMLDAKRLLQGFPHRFIRIAFKKYTGYPLDTNERGTINRFRKKTAKCNMALMSLLGVSDIHSERIKPLAGF